MEAGTAPAGEQLEREIAELLERDTFEPPPGFAERALFSDESAYEEAAADPEGWWAKQAEALTGSSAGTRCWTSPRRRSTSGSPAAR